MPQLPLSALERTLVEGGSPVDFTTYAAELTAAGDPVGALIALAVSEPDSPQVAIQRKALVPGKDLGRTWENGLIVAGRVVENRKTGSGTKWLEEVCGSSAGRLLQRLDLVHNAATHSYKGVLAALVKAAPQALRSLAIEGVGATGFDGIEGLATASPGLEQLVLVGKFSQGALKALATSWPSLTVLALDFHGTPIWKSSFPAKLLKPLFSHGALPAIDRLRLERSGMGDDLLELIAASGLLSQLSFLQLGGFFTADAVAAFTSQVPQACTYVITRYEPVDSRQRIVDLIHRCATPELQADYERLWVQTEEEPWWLDPSAVFSGATASRVPGLFEAYQSTLPDGMLHGRQARLSSKQRSDEMYWFGLQHGRTSRFSPNRAPGSQGYRNGLHDDRVEVLGDDGSVKEVLVSEQGVFAGRIQANETDASRLQREFQQRFGVELTTRDNDRYSLGARTPPNPMLASLPIIAEALRTADEGRVRVQTMTLTSGEPFTLVTYHLGDTLCGYILDGTDVVAVISDMGIAPPS
jgi:hypothetical protein